MNELYDELRKLADTWDRLAKHPGIAVPAQVQAEQDARALRSMLDRYPDPPATECPYCDPDGTERYGDGAKICSHCGGSHIAHATDEEMRERVAQEIAKDEFEHNHPIGLDWHDHYTFQQKRFIHTADRILSLLRPSPAKGES